MITTGTVCIFILYRKQQDMNNKITTAKLPRKYYSLVFGTIMGLIMSILTALAVTVVNIGITDDFFQ